MYQIPEWIKNLIQKHPEYFEEDKISFLYKKVGDIRGTQLGPFTVRDLTEFLLGAEINPLEYIQDAVNRYMFLRLNLPETNIILNESISQIEASAFEGSNIVTLNTNEVISINHSAFKDCTQLTKVIMPQVGEIQSNTFENCSALTEVDWKSCAQGFVSGEAFRGCTSLKRLEIPDGVYYLGRRFLRDSGVEDLYLPDTLEDVDILAFASAPALKNVYYGGTVEQWSRVNTVGLIKTSSVKTFHCIDGDYTIIDN